MSQHADESIDQDPLSEFATEPERLPQAAATEAEPTQTAANADVTPPVQVDEAAAASHAALISRLDRLEKADQRTIDQLSFLRAEFATLVAAIDDIRKRDVRRDTYAARVPRVASAPVSRSRRVPAVVGVVVGLAIAVVGWMTWQRESIAMANTAPAQVVAEPPAAVDVVAPAPAPPSVALAITNVAQPRTRNEPAREEPAREVVETHRADTAYVGTLSIDASPGGAVFINRQPAGQTPLRVSNLKAGSHLVWIERDGYRRFTRVVQVPANQVSRVFADLERLTP